MVEVKVRDSAVAPQAAAPHVGASAEVTDARGRVIRICRLSISRRRVLAKIVPGEMQASPMFMELAFPAIVVESIDGEPVLTPTNLMQLEALIDRLDNHGINAAAGQLTKFLADENPSAAELKNE